MRFSTFSLRISRRQVASTRWRLRPHLPRCPRLHRRMPMGAMLMTMTFAPAGLSFPLLAVSGPLPGRKDSAYQDLSAPLCRYRQHQPPLLLEPLLPWGVIFLRREREPLARVVDVPRSTPTLRQNFPLLNPSLRLLLVALLRRLPGSAVGRSRPRRTMSLRECPMLMFKTRKRAMTTQMMIKAVISGVRRPGVSLPSRR